VTLRCGVIGAGWFGRAHCRVLRDLTDVRLVAVADSDLSRVNEVAQIYGCKAYVDAFEMLEKEKLDTVSIVVSPQNLSKVASQALDYGLGGILVEKPVATSLKEVNELTSKSEKRKVPVMPGFIELFNPCIERLQEAIKKDNEIGEPYVASSKRIGRNPKRGWDIGVLLDLGIHEIYVLRKLFGSPQRVFCQTKSYGGGKTEDMANLIIEFENGVLGMVETNWITPIGIRSMIVTGSEGSVDIDYITQELKLINKERIVRPHFTFEEPLKRELKAFTDAVARGENPPVNLRDAEESLKTAFAALNSAKEMQVVEL
jgi:UDP-N-acetylglucosamine 3-dehydrogenase